MHYKIIKSYNYDQASTTYNPFLSIKDRRAFASTSVLTPWVIIIPLIAFLTSAGMRLADPEMNIQAP
jgi:hypothetical protein